MKVDSRYEPESYGAGFGFGVFVGVTAASVFLFAVWMLWGAW
jgi:hypothetical protein